MTSFRVPEKILQFNKNQPKDFCWIRWSGWWNRSSGLVKFSLPTVFGQLKPATLIFWPYPAWLKLWIKAFKFLSFLSFLLFFHLPSPLISFWLLELLYLVYVFKCPKLKSYNWKSVRDCLKLNLYGPKIAIQGFCSNFRFPIGFLLSLNLLQIIPGEGRDLLILV